MAEIILKRQKSMRKPKRASVVIQPDTYIRVYEMAHEIGIPMEQLVDKLLQEALELVRIED